MSKEANTSPCHSIGHDGKIIIMHTPIQETLTIKKIRIRSSEDPDKTYPGVRFGYDCRVCERHITVYEKE